MAVKEAKTPKKGGMFHVTAYRLARSGASDRQIAEALGMAGPAFKARAKKDPELAAILGQARGEASSGLRGAVAGRLSPEALGLWERLERAGLVLDPGERRRHRGEAMALIDEAPAITRMSVFVMALAASGFIPGEACRLSGIPEAEVARWRAADPRFREVMEGVLEAKRDFFESCLVGLCKRGDAAAIIFANRTLCASRGYGDKQKVEVDIKNTVTYQHRVTLEDLPLEARRALLEATRKKREQIGMRDNVEDAEFTVASKEA